MNTKRRVAIHLLSMGAIVLLCTAAPAGIFFPLAEAATIHGRVQAGPDRSPKAYTGVRLSSTTKGPSALLYTDRDGEYYFRNVPGGEYTLNVYAYGDDRPPLQCMFKVKDQEDLALPIFRVKPGVPKTQEIPSRCQ